MKGFRSTGILFILVGLLAAYTFYEYRNAERDADLQMGESAAFMLKREEIDGIKLSLKGVVIELKKNGDQWQMEKPVSDWAENASVDGFLLSLLSQKLKTPRSAEEAKSINWADYGLEPADSILEISAKGKTEKLEVSAKTAFDGSYFARKGSELALGDPAFQQIVARSPASFRSRKLWREPEATQIESVNVELRENNQKASVYKVVRGSQGWSLEPKPNYEVDTEKLEAWIGRVKDLMPNEFIQENLNDTDKKNFLLLKPSMKIDVGYKRESGETGRWSVTLGQDKSEDVFLTTGQSSTVYKTSRASLVQLRVPELFFRNGIKPFAIDLERAREVEVFADKWHHVFAKGDSVWTLKGASKDVELDEDKLVALMQNIRSLEATEFMSSAQAKSLTPLVKIRDAQGQEIFVLAVGGEFNPEKPWNQGFKYKFVKTNLSKELLGVQKEKLDRLIDEGILKKKSEAKPSTQPESK